MGGREGLIDTAVQSVTGNTPIIIIENNQPKYVKIGDWIDAYLDNAPEEKKKFYPEQNNLEMLELEHPVYIPTCDKDGKVTQAEIDKSRQERLAEFDADKNGTLSLEEFKLLWLKSRNEMMVREFQFFDKDGNGVVTIEEYQAPMSDLVTRRDVNNDGALGPEDQRVQRLRRGDGPAWGKGMGEGHGMGHGRGNCEGHGWGQSDDESESAEPSDEKAPAEEQSTP